MQVQILEKVYDPPLPTHNNSYVSTFPTPTAVLPTRCDTASYGEGRITLRASRWRV